MYPTVEVRWFYKGEIPTKVLTDYIQGGDEPVHFPPRTDYYFVVPGRVDLGIKLREGLLEIKQRTKTHKVHQFNLYTFGIVESWQKWGFALSQPDSGSYTDKFSSRNASWSAVVKHRWLRKYEITPDRRALELPQSTTITNGCEWELSNVHLEGIDSPWWSIAFEAFGEEHRLFDSLVTAVKKALTNIEDQNFLRTDSFSYPAWLNLVRKGM